MACTLTTGRNVPCQNSIGGIQKLFLIPWEYDAWKDYTFDTTDDFQIDDAPSGTSCFEFKLRASSSSLTVTVANGDATAGAKAFYQQSAELVFNMLDVKSVEAFKKIGDQRVIAIVLDNNDKTWFIGFKNGCMISGGTIGTGTARGDMAGFTLTLTGEEDIPFFMGAQTSGVLTAGYPFDNLTNLSISATAIDPV